MKKLIILIISFLFLFFTVNSSGRMIDYFIRAIGAGGTVPSAGDTILWDASGDKVLWDASGDEVLWEN